MERASRGAPASLWQASRVQPLLRGLAAAVALVQMHSAFSTGWLALPRTRAQAMVAKPGSSCALASSLQLTPRELRTARGGNMQWHARDPYGVKHEENRRQAKEASILKDTLETIFQRGEVQCRRIGDEEIARRIRVDDVIMSPGCRAAYVHVAANGDRLEQRQAFVWLSRNKGVVKTALARYYKARGMLPQIWFVESRFDDWLTLFEKGRKYPELNLPDPYQQCEDLMPEMMKEHFRQVNRKIDFRKQVGMGDSKEPFPRWGYPSETI